VLVDDGEGSSAGVGGRGYSAHQDPRVTVFRCNQQVPDGVYSILPSSPLTPSPLVLPPFLLLFSNIYLQQDVFSIEHGSVVNLREGQISNIPQHANIFCDDMEFPRCPSVQIIYIR